MSESRVYRFQAPTGLSDGESDEEDIVHDEKFEGKTENNFLASSEESLQLLNNLYDNNKCLEEARNDIQKFRIKMYEQTIDEKKAYDDIETSIEENRHQLGLDDAAWHKKMLRGRERLLKMLQESHQMKSIALQKAIEETQKNAEEEQRRLKAQHAALEAQRKKQEEELEYKLFVAEEERQRLEKLTSVAELKPIPENFVLDKFDKPEQLPTLEENTSSDKNKLNTSESLKPMLANSNAKFTPEYVVASPAHIHEKECEASLLNARGSSEEVLLNPAFKSKRRLMARSIKTAVLQITGLTHQVEAKASDITMLLSSVNSDISLKSYAMLELSRCFLDAAVGTTAESRFAIGNVLAQVSAIHKELKGIFLGLLYEMFPLCVPKLLLQKKDEPRDVYLERWKFLKVDKYDKVKKKPYEDWESIHDYLQRTTDIVQLFAIFACNALNNYCNIGLAWSFMARLLNALPANRFSASCLAGFIEVAGYMLYKIYGQHFYKLINYIRLNFIPELESKSSTETNTLVEKLNMYINDRTFMKEPDGYRLADSRIDGTISF